jgi:hypothetical protein
MLKAVIAQAAQLKAKQAEGKQKVRKAARKSASKGSKKKVLAGRSKR